MRLKTNCLCVLPVLISLLFSACQQKEIDFPEPAKQIVVEGWIENGRFPKVYLTQSTSFFSKIDSAALFGMMVHQAKVTVSGNNETEILTLRLNPNHYPAYYYEGTSLKGKAGHAYSLKVELSGQVLTAVTTIPQAPLLDSVWVEYADDTIGYIAILFTDDASTKNYYRSFMKVLGKDQDYVPTYVNTFDDSYFNGQTFRFRLFRGYSSLTDLYNLNKYFEKGDTLMVKICELDQDHYAFWNTFQGKLLNLNSFSASTDRVASNIQGGLGIWGGYGSSYYRVIAR